MPQTHQMNRVTDPVLSNIAHGYRQGDYIGEALFPRVCSPRRGARVIRFGKEMFMKHDVRRAPGAKIERAMYGFASEPVAMPQYALSATVPYEWVEESEGVPNVDHERNAVEVTTARLLLSLECEQAALAEDPNNYATDSQVALTGADQWSDPTSNPAQQIREYQQVVRKLIGRKPNVMKIGADVFDALVEHPRVRDQFKHTTADSITVDMLARLFQLDKVVVAQSLVVDPNDASQTLQEVWNPKSAILAYVPQEGQQIAVPSFGYTYVLRQQNMDMGVESARWDADCKQWVYDVMWDRQPILTSMDAGFLVQDAVA